MERFVHLHVRNPKPGDILVASLPTPYYIACALLSWNTGKAYVISDTNWINPYISLKEVSSINQKSVQNEIK
jgi:hypothetical protein